MTLSKNIRYLRKKHNMSQEDLANRLGYKSFTTIQKWESGVSEPTMKKMRALCEVFDVDMDELAKSDMDNPTNEIHTAAAHLDAKDFAPEDWDRIEQFAAFVREQNKAE